MELLVGHKLMPKILNCDLKANPFLKRNLVDITNTISGLVPGLSLILFCNKFENSAFHLLIVGLFCYIVGS